LSLDCREQTAEFYKSKLEMKSNLSETFPFNCKYICDFTQILSDKTQTWVSEIWFLVQKKKI